MQRSGLEQKLKNEAGFNVWCNDGEWLKKNMNLMLNMEQFYALVRYKLEQKSSTASSSYKQRQS